MTNETPPFPAGLAQPVPFRQDRLAEPTPLGFGRGRAPDPVDAAIERHRAAYQELTRATAALGVAEMASRQAEEAAETARAAASDADGAAWADLVATRPASMTGAVRLLRYVSTSPDVESVSDTQALLQQLTAAVEAVEAGSGQGDGAGVVGEAVAAVEPDPALAVVAEFRAAWDALGHAIEAAGGAGVPEVDPAIENREGEAYERLKTVRPTTPEGFRALASAWAMVLGGERMNEPGLQHADHAADSLIAGAGACVPITVSGGGDRVHDLIEAHRSAHVEWDRLSGIWNEMVPDDPGYAQAINASKAPGKREAAAFDALFSARPTTLVGATALASYLVEVVRRTRIDPSPSDGERALGTVAAALYGIAPGGPFSGEAPATVNPAPADAALLALGDEFMAAWVHEARTETAEAFHAVNAVAARIAVAPAETAAGYGIKALLLARLFGEGSSPLAPETIPPRGPVFSVWHMLRQVQQGAARLAGVSVAASAPEPAVGDHQEACDHDLAGMSVAQLAQLYGALEPFEDLVGRAENAPCFWSEDRTVRTSAGDVICWEAERLAALLCGIAGEIERRQPADDDERDERLRVLVRRAASRDGLTTDRALLTEALAACAR